jgi:hypothetical protein
VVAAIICTAAFVICKKKKKIIRPRKRYTRLEQNEQSLEMRREHRYTVFSNPRGAGGRETLGLFVYFEKGVIRFYRSSVGFYS